MFKQFDWNSTTETDHNVSRIPAFGVRKAEIIRVVQVIAADTRNSKTSSMDFVFNLAAMSSRLCSGFASERNVDEPEQSSKCFDYLSDKSRAAAS